jgi:hypothetical protein
MISSFWKAMRYLGVDVAPIRSAADLAPCLDLLPAGFENSLLDKGQDGRRQRRR